jgi:thiamine biosynthesis lipoprotein
LKTIAGQRRFTLPTAPVIIGADELECVRRFRAMNTDVVVRVLDPLHVPILHSVEALFHDIERRFSRFSPDSELSRMNEAAGAPVSISSEMASVLASARRLHRATNGIFNPCVLQALEAAGYDRSFERVAPFGRAADAPLRQARSFTETTLHAARRSFEAPAGVRIDLGGIGKGYAVDMASRLLDLVPTFIIDAGGDIFAKGGGPDGGGWLASVAAPSDVNVDLTLVRLRDQAIATSSVATRAWVRGSRRFHHIIDPRTGAPAETDVVSASVIARRAVEADVFAKTAVILGSFEGIEFLAGRGVDGYLVLDDGTSVETPGWPSISE